MKLREELEAVKYPGTTDEFVELLADLFANMYPGFTDEQLYRRPDDAKFFCHAVRRKMVMKHPECEPAPDCVIIGALQNARKASRVRGGQK